MVMLFAISRCKLIVIDYIVNVIVISDYFHDYTIFTMYIMPEIWLVCKAKDNNRTDLPIDRLLSYLYT